MFWSLYWGLSLSRFTVEMKQVKGDPLLAAVLFVGVTLGLTSPFSLGEATGADPEEPGRTPLTGALTKWVISCWSQSLPGLHDCWSGWLTSATTSNKSEKLSSIRT